VYGLVPSTATEAPARTPGLHPRLTAGIVGGMELVPLTPDRYDDLAALFGTTVVTRDCHCTWFLLLDPERREVWAAGGARDVFERSAPGGILGYLDGGPAGWVAAGPRSAYPRLARSKLWAAGDPDAWVVTCFYLRRTARHRGLTRSLLQAAVAHAGRQGAAAVEGVPRLTGVRTSPGDAYVGHQQVFAGAGFTEVARPSDKRVLMRREL
jgi:GNAT superfamily N-acetyltransferase